MKWSKLALLLVAAGAALPQAAAAQGSQYCPAPQGGGQQSWYDAQPATIDGAKSYTYKPVAGGDLRLHVFQPGTFSTSANAWDPTFRKGNGKAPAILIFYGGGWSIGSVERFRGEAVHLASRGMVAILADYRVHCRYNTGVAEAVSDAKSAVRWVRSHSAELGIDPDRLVVGGGSAGGHIALSTATLDGFDEPGENVKVSARPDALVLFYPAVDLSQNPAPKIYAPLIGDRGRDLSPLYHLRRGLPPTLMLMGTADDLYPPAAKYCSEAKAIGNDCQMFTYEGAPHGFDIASAGKPENAGQAAVWYEDAIGKIDRFLERLGYLKRP
jgi:acetyl esterase